MHSFEQNSFMVSPVSFCRLIRSENNDAFSIGFLRRKILPQILQVKMHQAEGLRLIMCVAVVLALIAF